MDPGPQHAQPGQPADQPGLPARGGPIGPDRARDLLTGKILFSPNAIPSSNQPVEEGSTLFVGDDVQVKWGSSWWAGTVLGLEPDGKVRIRYFGWAESWNEVKPRSELQFDPRARVRALDSTFVRQGW